MSALSVQAMEFFPRGILPYLLGGVLIGLGISVIYLLTGIIAGASTFLESTLSYVSGVTRFQQSRFVNSRNWRVLFTAGIISGAGIYTLLVEPTIWTTDVQWWRLFLGGTLVGIGTRLGKGCTSGHGVCGTASASKTSIINVVIFLFVAIGTAHLVQAMGVVP